MSNEIKVALLAIVAIALAYWGFRFIQGKNILTRSNLYYVSYDQIDGMAKSVPVRIRGFEVGYVADIKFSDDYQNIIVTLDLSKDIVISKNTVAAITADGIMGGKYVELLESTCVNNDCAKSGDSIEGITRSLLSSMVGQSEFKEYFKIVGDGIQNIIDSLNQKLMSGDGESGLSKTLKNLENTVANLESSSGQFDQLLRKSSDDIEGSMENLNTITGTIAENNDKIKSILENTDKMTADLSQGELKQTLEESLAAVKELRGTLKKADGMVGSFTSIAEGINKGEGTLGKLMKDEAMYNELVDALTTLDTILETFDERPYRYMPFKNRKKVLRYDRLDAKAAEEGNN